MKSRVRVFTIFDHAIGPESTTLSPGRQVERSLTRFLAVHSVESVKRMISQSIWWMVDFVGCTNENHRIDSVSASVLRIKDYVVSDAQNWAKLGN